MKRNILIIMAVIMSILSFQGCKTKHKYYDINISKIGNIELLTIEEIREKHNLSLNDSRMKDYLGYKDKSDLKKLKIEFFTEFSKNHSTNPLILNPCSSKKIYDIYENDYPERSQLFENENDVYRVHTYFDMEILKELGYIAKNSEEQEDLCLFTQFTSEYGMFSGLTIEHYKSNKLVYKAEEINNIVEAYENMK